jgi:glycine C-acetyltransferase
MKNVFSSEMKNLDAAGLLTAELSVVHTANMEARLESGNSPVNFISNDLLGWGFNDAIRQSANEACAAYGTGSTSSRSSIGTHDVLTNLEQRLAQFLSMEDCIVFPSMYAANMGIFETLTNQKDKIFVDEMCNPGVLDGTQLSSAKVVPYLHNDDENLEYHLKCSQNARFRLIASDGVFGTTGQCANLQRIHELKGIYDAVSLIDDSLGIGILGQQGRGTCDHLQLESRADLISGNFAYALGNVGGGFVSGTRELISWLRHTSRPYILSEPLSPINAAIILKVLDILESGTSPIEKLHASAERVKADMRQRDWKLMDGDHPTISLIVGSTLNAQKMVEHLMGQGLLVSGLCYPNTPEGESVIRICLTVNHTDEQIQHLIRAIEGGFALLN